MATEALPDSGSASLLSVYLSVRRDRRALDSSGLPCQACAGPCRDRFWSLDADLHIEGINRTLRESYTSSEAG